MCLHKREQRASYIGGQLFCEQMVSEFDVTTTNQVATTCEKAPEECCRVAPTVEACSDDQEAAADQMLYRDVLVGATQATKQLFDGCKDLAAMFRESTAYKILTRTTQPSHAISMVFVSFVLLVLWPNIVGQPSTTDDETEEVASITAIKCAKTQTRASVMVALVYFGSFAMHFGAQMWMTFVSGLALYFNLPRHTFGRVQEILFPKYFSMGSALSVATLLSFIKLQQTAHPELANAAFRSWDPQLLVQLVSLALCASLELVVCLYLAPPMIRLMHQKYHFEASETVGQEIGHFSGTENAQLRRSLHYKSVHKRFRQIHMVTAMANMVALLCTFVHLHYLASRIVML